jgi:hypothetical protein
MSEVPLYTPYHPLLPDPLTLHFKPCTPQLLDPLPSALTCESNPFNPLREGAVVSRQRDRSTNMATQFASPRMPCSTKKETLINYSRITPRSPVKRSADDPCNER